MAVAEGVGSHTMVEVVRIRVAVVVVVERIHVEGQ